MLVPQCDHLPVGPQVNHAIDNGQRFEDGGFDIVPGQHPQGVTWPPSR